MTWNVGDEIIVQESRNYSRVASPTHPYVVTKVARKYFHAKELGEGAWREGMFEIATGRQKSDPNYTQYADRAYTPEQWEAKRRRDALNARLRAHKVEFGPASAFGSTGYRLTEAALEAILAILDAEKLRIESER